MSPSLDFIGLTVADLPASLRFYRRLGIDVPAGADTEPHAEATLPNGLRLAWDTAAGAASLDPGREAPSGGYRIALAFRCADPAEVDATYADLVEAGYRGHAKPWDAFWGQRYATVLDPDGNGVDLYAPLG
jgi:uncharacterized glyoxalase superfamily protein PhnB